MASKRKRFSVTARLIVEVEEDDNSDIVKGLLEDLIDEDWRVRNVVFIGEPILLKDIEQHDEDSISPNESDMGTTKRD